MSAFSMARREQLCDKLQNFYLYFRRSMVANIDPSELSYQGVDIYQFDLAEETARGGIYFQPMSQERLNTLDKRPDFEKIGFWPDHGYPSNADAYMIHDTVNEQLRCSKEYNDLWSAYESTSWEPVGTCCKFEDQLHEFDCDRDQQTQNPTRQTTWTLHDVFATKNDLPHRSCMACGEIMDVTGPTRHELMILTALMMVRMQQETYVKHELFPVLLLSAFGSKARIIEAYMSPEQQRLQVRHSELFDFRNLTKEWLDIFVRWFLNEPLAEPLSSSPEKDMSEQQPESSDDANEVLTAMASDSDTSLSDGPRSSEQGGIPQKKPVEPSPISSPGMNTPEQQLESSDDTDESLVDASSESGASLSNGPRSPEQGTTHQKPIARPMWIKSRMQFRGESLHQALAMRPTLLNAQ